MSFGWSFVVISFEDVPKKGLYSFTKNIVNRDGWWHVVRTGFVPFLVVDIDDFWCLFLNRFWNYWNFTLTKNSMRSWVFWVCKIKHIDKKGDDFIKDGVVVSKIFGFSPLLCEMIQFDDYFSNGLVQPPTSQRFNGPCGQSNTNKQLNSQQFFLKTPTWAGDPRVGSTTKLNKMALGKLL